MRTLLSSPETAAHVSSFFVILRINVAYNDSFAITSSISPECSERIELLAGGIVGSKEKIDLANKSLNLEQFELLNIALNNNEIKVSALRSWLENGGEVRTDIDSMSSFGDLYLNAWVCLLDNNGTQSLEAKAKKFLDLYEDKLLQFNPHIIVRLCEKFINLKLPLLAAKYLEQFLSDEVWASPAGQTHEHLITS